LRDCAAKRAIGPTTATLDYRAARRRAEEQTQQALKAAKDAARALAKAGLSVRDAGSLLGLTGARVSQILKSGQRRSG
jgi:hypothetical protein